MKKTLITLLALASVASAQTPLPLLPDLKTQSEYLHKNSSYNKEWHTNNCIGGNLSVTSNIINENITNSPILLDTGWRWALGNRNSGGSNFIPGENSFQFICERGYNGIFVVATRKVSDLLTQPNEVLTSLTISFKASGQSDIGFSAWLWDGSQATTLIKETKTLNVDNDIVNTFTEEGLSLDANQTILFLWNECYDFTKLENASRVNVVSVDNSITALSSSYTTAAIVPEPTTTTLSLLALAGLAARRRRAAH